MKVLWQIWTSSDGAELESISRDEEQLQKTIQELSPQDDSENEEILEAIPKCAPQEIDIPDDSIFAEMVESRTVFLHPDEMDIIWNNLPDN